VRCDGRHPTASATRDIAITTCHVTAMPDAWFAMTDSPSRISVACGIGLSIAPFVPTDSQSRNGYFVASCRHHLRLREILRTGP